MVGQIYFTVSSRDASQTNFVHFRPDLKLIYRRYAGLLFVFGVELADSDFVHLELIHLLVEMLDLFFTDVCELDLVFNFHKLHMIVDEVIVGGEVQEVSKTQVIERLKRLD